MVITVTCSSCSSSFPVDPAKIPPKGVSARCSSCGYVFRIEKPADAAAPPPFVSEPDPLPSAPEAPAVPQAGDAGFRFGKRDPTDKAKRLARVLVSDMIMYNADRHVSALEGGTLAEDFEEEIDKSWKEFVEQVGPEIADGQGRGFWTDALNDILAKGEQLF
jgi:predicted Zn finger-like uncharacterized protein